MPNKLNKTYYSIVSTEKGQEDELLTGDTFKSDREAIQYAKEREAFLFKHVYVDGEQKNLDCLLFDPFVDKMRKVDMQEGGVRELP